MFDKTFLLTYLGKLKLTEAQFLISMGKKFHNLGTLQIQERSN